MLRRSRYSDDNNEYRHVQLPKQMLKVIPKDYFDGQRGTLKLMWEDEWRGLGITQVRATLFRSVMSMVLRCNANPWSCCRVWVGSTTKCTSLSRTSCCSSALATLRRLCSTERLIYWPS